MLHLLAGKLLMGPYCVKSLTVALQVKTNCLSNNLSALR